MPTHDNEADDTADGGASLNPHQAAALMDQSRRDAQHQLDVHPPVIMIAMGAAVLVAYGALWLSTRGQHPYSGPNGGVIALTYTIVVVTAVVAARIYRTATKGVSGESISRQRIEGVAMLASVLGSPAIQGAMYHQHASHAIVYGVIPAAGPLIVIGTTLLGIAAAKFDRPQFGAAFALVTAGMVALFLGPSRAWLAAGAGVFVAVAGFSIARAILRHGKDVAWVPTTSTQ
jgi:hypothetical protein